MPVVTRRKNIQFQLAKVYEGKPLAGLHLLEPKLDGVRCALVFPHEGEPVALSRTGLPFQFNVGHILRELAPKFRGLVLDGELMAEDWNKTQSITSSEFEHPDALTLKFHAFDMLPIHSWEQKKNNTKLIERKQQLITLLGDPHPGDRRYQYTLAVRHWLVETNAVAEQLRDGLVKEGYEGAMLKDALQPYQFKKSSDWLKMKPFYEGDFQIADAVEGRGKHEGVLGALVIHGGVEWKGKLYHVHCEVGTGFSDDERHYLWMRHKAGTLRAKEVEVKFQEIGEEDKKTGTAKLRFPSFYRLREDK